MTFSPVVLSLALSTLGVPPDEKTPNHAQPYHGGQPVVRTFERHKDDHDRRLAWEAYVRELGQLWKDYRAAGSTPRAWREFQEAVGMAKRRYVIGDIYYKPIENEKYGHP